MLTWSYWNILAHLYHAQVQAAEALPRKDFLNKDAPQHKYDSIVFIFHASVEWVHFLFKCFFFGVCFFCRCLACRGQSLFFHLNIRNVLYSVDFVREKLIYMYPFGNWTAPWRHPGGYEAHSTLPLQLCDVNVSGFAFASPLLSSLLVEGPGSKTWKSSLLVEGRTYLVYFEHTSFIMRNILQDNA